MQLAEGQCVLAVTHYLFARVCECACISLAFYLSPLNNVTYKHIGLAETNKQTNKQTTQEATRISGPMNRRDSCSINCCLGRWYDASLKDKEQVDQLRKDVASGLENINRTALPGKLKLWCMQFGLLPRLLWPLTMYEVPISKVEKLERLVSSYARK